MTSSPASAVTYLVPMPRSRDAPQFSSDASGFNIFFEDVEELATRAGLSESQKIKWVIRYTGSESDAWRFLPCMSDPTKPPTFEQFRTDVVKCYPNISATRRYTNRDFDCLVDQTRTLPGMSLDDLGAYYRKFITVATYVSAIIFNF